MPYSNALVQIGTTPTPIASVAERGGLLIQNNGSAAVFLGGRNVGISGPNTGIQLASGATIFVPSVGTNAEALFGVAAATQPVCYLYPSD